MARKIGHGVSTTTREGDNNFPVQRHTDTETAGMYVHQKPARASLGFYDVSRYDGAKKAKNARVWLRVVRQRIRDRARLVTVWSISIIQFMSSP